MYFSQSVSFDKKVLLEDVTSSIRQTNVAGESRWAFRNRITSGLKEKQQTSG